MGLGDVPRGQDVSDTPAKPKSPGRVAAAKRLNELGLRGTGGRPPSHGFRALEALLAHGAAPAGPLGVLLAEREAAYLADIGGRENVSSMEAGVCRRLAGGDLFLSLLVARVITPNGRSSRLTWQQTKDLAALHARLSESYTRMAQALGLKRRAKDVPTLEDLLADAAGDGNGASGQ